VDSVDRQIVDELVRHARISLTDIASAVSLSLPAVKRRVDRLERTGVIRGYTAILGAADDFGRVQALVEVFCHPGARREEVVRLLTAKPEVRLAYTTAGESDLVLLVRTDDAGHLERFLIELREQSVVVRTRAQVLLGTLVDRFTS
jgi:Lrp/AsnC family leucine-responsive transcriptional regulator